jgi:hypothetical protein
VTNVARAALALGLLNGRRGPLLSIQSGVHELRAEVKGAARKTRPWVVVLGRAGYVARAVLYLTIGVLAATTAFGEGGRLTDSQGALDELYRQPLGIVLMVLMSIGLGGYGVWLAVKAVVNPGNEATGKWPRLRRVGWFADALLHFALAAYAISLLAGSADKTDAKTSAASALSSGPMGPAFLASVGAGLVGYGFYEMFCAWRAKLDEQLDLSPLRAGARQSVVQLCRIGIAARSVVFIISGVFLIAAGVTSDASQAKGFGDALQLVREAPYGQTLLAAVALGLIAFGAYQLVEARYRRLFGRAADNTYGRRQLEETWRLERHARRHAPVSTRAHSHE